MGRYAFGHGLGSGRIVVLLLVGACGKSAQGPFFGWLARAMEGPTPSSAVFYGAISVHAGAFLLLRVQPPDRRFGGRHGPCDRCRAGDSPCRHVAQRTGPDAKTSLRTPRKPSGFDLRRDRSGLDRSRAVAHRWSRDAAHDAVPPGAVVAAMITTSCTRPRGPTAACGSLVRPVANGRAVLVVPVRHGGGPLRCVRGPLRGRTGNAHREDAGGLRARPALGGTPSKAPHHAGPRTRCKLREHGTDELPISYHWLAGPGDRRGDPAHARSGCAAHAAWQWVAQALRSPVFSPRHGP
ncbi:MAG: hypothetical protein IPH53_11965 [Flavobacteriales bacterium]|nr:hypothetical protein [Flavobacteriales bacterium]